MGLISDAAVSRGDVARHQADQARQIAQVRTARRAEATTVSADGTVYRDGGGIEVLDGGGIAIRGGALRMTSDDGTVGLLYFGDGAGGGRTWQFSFPSGDGAFGLFGSTAPGFWAGKDHGNHIIVGNDAQSGAGLARPYLNIPMVPSSGTSIGTGGPFWPEFVNDEFQEVMYRITTLWHPKIAVGVNVSNASGTVEWELRVDGVTAGSSSGDTQIEVGVPGWGETTVPGDQRSVQLWARNTDGTAARLMVDRCYGTQS